MPAVLSRRPVTMRERILAVVRGEEVDRVPFVMYEGIMPMDEALRLMGPGRVGFMRWCRVHTVETPHCVTETVDWEEDGARWRRNTIHTPAGDIFEERRFEEGYGSSSIRKHYVERPEDYPALWAYLEDGVVLENHAQFHADQADLGEHGVPLVAIDRTPYQQLWVQWVGLDNLPFHLADCPDRVARTVDLLTARARKIMEIARTSPAPFVDFPDNITAPTIGPARFREFCVPLYDELADMLGERRPVFVHMDGDLRPLWGAIAASRVGGIDSLSPAPENDTPLGEAARMWPEKRLWVNYPSSSHLLPAEGVRAVAEGLLAEAGHTGRLQVQISENVPHSVTRISLPAIADAVEAFGRP